MSDDSTAPQFAVDFSEAALDGQVSVLVSDAVKLTVDQHVQLIDDEGNTAPGVVTKIDKHVAWVRPQLDRISLNPADFSEALRAMLHTAPER